MTDTPAEPDPLRRALEDAIAAAQRLGLSYTAGELIGVLAMRESAPGVCLALLRCLPAFTPTSLDEGVLGERVARAIALLEQQSAEAA